MSIPRYRVPIPRMSGIKTLLPLARAGHEYRHWYTDARKSIDYVCGAKGWNRDTLIDLLAICSPRVSVRRSIRFAMMVIQDEYPADMTRSTLAAIDHWQQTGEIRGPKTSAFARALRGDEDAVVLDVWMAVAFGVDQRQFSRPAVRYRCEKRINKAAQLIGTTPSQCQAAVWAAVVKENGRAVRGIDFDDELTIFDTLEDQEEIDIPY